MRKIVFGKCIDLSSEGKGVVKLGKDIAFIDGLFPNEEGEIEIQYSRSGVYFGKVHKLTKISQDRIQPKCKVCTICGGCQFQQLDYKAQLDFKTNRVKNALSRIGGLVNFKVFPTIGMKNPYHYRNKIQVPFSKDKKGRIIYGFYRHNSHEIVAYKNCQIEDNRAESILWDIKILLEEFKIPIHNEDNRSGLFRYALIRTSYHFNEIMLVLVVSKLNFPSQHNFINKLISLHPEITTVVANENSRKTNVILGSKEKILFGKGYIVDSILDLTFNISASSFYQVNPIQVEILYKTAIDLIDPNKDKVVLDAYSGVGTIGLLACKNAEKVISVEINKQAHRNAIDNAKNNNINNIEFYCDDASKFITNYKDKLDVVIMDPPRSGSDEEFLQVLIDKKVKKIIYISCDPETLSRDIKYLSKHYNVTYIQPVDMFPMTSHIETVCALSLKKSC